MKKIIVENIDVPPDAMVDYEFMPLDYKDAFRVRLPEDSQMEMSELINHLFGEKESYPDYVRFLLALRDWLVRPFGLKTASDMKKNQLKGEWNGFFLIYRCSRNEIVMGDDDRHLDVRVSCLRTIRNHQPYLTVSTFVRFNNLLGRVYFAVIKPFHRIIVPSTMKKFIGNMMNDETRGHVESIIS